MAKKITLFAIYCKQGKDAIAKTAVAFTTEKEAAAYCEYINKAENLGENMVFFWREERLVIYKNARTLIDDENEDAILFS